MYKIYQTWIELPKKRYTGSVSGKFLFDKGMQNNDVRPLKFSLKPFNYHKNQIHWGSKFLAEVLCGIWLSGILFVWKINSIWVGILMSFFEAILLGALQGLAEFLPISSSGHLQIAEHLLHLKEVPLLFDILLHLATLAAVCLVFYKTIARLFAVLGRFIIRKSKLEDKEDLQMIAALLIATVVTGVFGLLLKDWVKTLNIKVIPVCFIITGAVLFLSEKIQIKKNLAVPSLFGAFIIGLAQGIGVTPGISRSGSTISAALFTGLSRERAGEFSFLLSIPAILAAFILELKSADTLSVAVPPVSLIGGMLTAFVVGFFSLKFLLKLINGGKLGFFAYYLIPAGILLLIFL